MKVQTPNHEASMGEVVEKRTSIIPTTKSVRAKWLRKYIMIHNILSTRPIGVNG